MFLQDTTGNRRFWPVDVGEHTPEKRVWSDLTDDVINQVWAEAKMRWQTGEAMYLTGAIARAMTPGCKYDTMLILAGPQGLGKSTLLDKMSRGWFNDSIRTFEGK
ncbi:MAG: hypothetical protein IKT76_07580, partial [Bacteroides sp.]|nr:hypothetical protein [Bacteroides sp.]